LQIFFLLYFWFICHKVYSKLPAEGQPSAALLFALALAFFLVTFLLDTVNRYSGFYKELGDASFLKAY